MFDWIDAVGALWVATVFLGLPLLGWAAMILDFRAYLRSLRRALVLVRTHGVGAPLWALRDRPTCLKALDLAPGCTKEEVWAAYRRIVKVVHPDHGGDRARFDELQQRLHEALRLVEAGE